MDVAPDPIFQVASGFMAAKHLFMANETGLFETLADGPATLDSLAATTDIPRRTTRILADAMVALGLLERDGNQYRNSPAADTYLSGKTPADLRPFLRLWDRLSYPRWVELEKAIRTGEAVFGELEYTQEEQEIYSDSTDGTTDDIPTDVRFVVTRADRGAQLNEGVRLASGDVLEMGKSLPTLRCSTPPEKASTCN